MSDGHGGVLESIRALDLTRVLAGPDATMMPADFGADVMKIESPAGDVTRSWRPPLARPGRRSGDRLQEQEPIR